MYGYLQNVKTNVSNAKRKGPNSIRLVIDHIYFIPSLIASAVYVFSATVTSIVEEYEKYRKRKCQGMQNPLMTQILGIARQLYEWFCLKARG